MSPPRVLRPNPTQLTLCTAPFTPHWPAHPTHHPTHRAWPHSPRLLLTAPLTARCPTHHAWPRSPPTAPLYPTHPAPSRTVPHRPAQPRLPHTALLTPHFPAYPATPALPRSLRTAPPAPPRQNPAAAPGAPLGGGAPWRLQPEPAGSVPGAPGAPGTSGAGRERGGVSAPLPLIRESSSPWDSVAGLHQDRPNVPTLSQACSSPNYAYPSLSYLCFLSKTSHNKLCAVLHIPNVFHSSRQLQPLFLQRCLHTRVLS